jgi:ribonuclease D
LNEVELGVLRELAKWRDHVAETINKPVPSVANDLALKAMAQRAPRDLKAIESIRGLGVGRNEPWASQALEAIGSGVSKPEPNVRSPFSSEQEARLDGVMSLLRIARHYVAVRDGIAVDLLCDSAELRALAETRLGAPGAEPSCGVLSGWRRTVVGDLLLNVLSGKVAFRVGLAAPAGVCMLSE